MRTKRFIQRLPREVERSMPVFSYVDEGPSWNRLFEIFRRYDMTYVVEYGPPHYWGSREIVGITEYEHFPF